MNVIFSPLILSAVFLVSCSNAPTDFPVESEAQKKPTYNDLVLCDGIINFDGIIKSYGVYSSDSYYERLAKDSEAPPTNSQIRSVYTERNIPNLNQIETVNIGDEMVMQFTETETLVLAPSASKRIPFRVGNILLPKQFVPPHFGASLDSNGVIDNIFDNTTADILGVKIGDKPIVNKGGRFDVEEWIRREVIGKDEITLLVDRDGELVNLVSDNRYGQVKSKNLANLAGLQFNGRCRIPHDSALLDSINFNDYFARKYMSQSLLATPNKCVNGFCGKSTLFIEAGKWSLVKENEHGSFYVLPINSSIEIDYKVGWLKTIDRRLIQPEYKLHPDWHIYMPRADSNVRGVATVQLLDGYSSNRSILTIPKEYLPDVTYKTETRTTPNTMQQSLYYNGLSGNTLKFTYREFKGDLARNSFTQDVTYDLKVGEIIGFKNSRFKILKADNLTVTYKVLSHF